MLDTIIAFLTMQFSLVAMLPTLTKWGITALKMILLLIVGWPLSTSLANQISEFFKRIKMETTVRRSLKSLINVSLKGIILVILLSMTGIKMTVLAAVLGGFSISLGLALKGNISNVANGILLLTNKPFRAGDSIETGSLTGTVERIDLINTELKTPNNQKVIIPNSQLLNSALTNFATHPTRRIELVVGLSYSDNMQTACEQLKVAIQATEGVLTEPAVDVWLTDFGESSINLSVRAWCNRSDFLRVRHHVIITIQKACAAHGLSIPFPQRDIHMISDNG